MSYVLVIDQDKRPLDPVHPGRARHLLSKGQAAVYRRYPFVLILKRQAPELAPQPFRLKLDPGSKTTGLAVVNDASGQVMWGAELAHRGEQVRAGLLTRRRLRRGRRHRHTRYRQPRWRNRRRPRGWLAPSLVSRLQNVLTWVQRCAYCAATGLPLEIDHVQPRSKGGSDRVSNLVIACHSCNQAKGNQALEAFLADRPEILARIQAQRKAPLGDAAVVNATRWALYERLKASGLPVETGSGGLTKWNRTTRGLPKCTGWMPRVVVPRPLHTCTSRRFVPG